MDTREGPLIHLNRIEGLLLTQKVFSGEKTQLSSEFQEFEREVDVKRVGIERYVPRPPVSQSRAMSYTGLTTS